MKKRIALLALGTSLAAAATQVSQHEKWHTVSNKKVTLQFEVADDPRQACERQSKAYGNKGFAYQVQACAFWWDDGRCHIITGKRVDLDSLGHELLHCIKGDWHPQDRSRP